MLRTNLLLFIVLALKALNIIAQESGPFCSYPDTLETKYLDSMTYNQSGWYTNRKNVYTRIDHRSEVEEYDNLTPVIRYNDLNLSIYNEDIQGDVFDGVRFIIDLEEYLLAWFVVIENNDNGEIHFSRPDSVIHPGWVLISYPHRFGSGMGSYDAVTNELWDVNAKARLAIFDSEYSQFYRAENMEDNSYEAHGFGFKREVTIHHDSLIFHSYDFTRHDTLIKRLENDKEDVSESETEIHCDKKVYLFFDGKFVIIPSKNN